MGGQILIAERPLIGGTLCLPRIGLWHFDAILDSPDQLSASVKVQLTDELELTGFVVPPSGPYTETGYYRIVGGAGGLGKACTAKAYGRCQLRLPLSDLLSSVGEKLSSDADAAVINTQLPAWSTLGINAGRQLRALLAAAPDGTAYRAAADGSIWVGLETWPAAADEGVEVGALPHETKIEIAPEDPTLMPGTKLADGRKVSYVEHKIDSGRIRSTVFLEVA